MPFQGVGVEGVRVSCSARVGEGSRLLTQPVVVDVAVGLKTLVRRCSLLQQDNPTGTASVAAIRKPMAKSPELSG